MNYVFVQMCDDGIKGSERARQWQWDVDVAFVLLSELCPKYKYHSCLL